MNISVNHLIRFKIGLCKFINKFISYQIIDDVTSIICRQIYT